ncbi:MAG: response regulator transcription factor [Anaerolineales bacterium]|jgi:DNA-binding response OmpR family regulator
MAKILVVDDDSHATTLLEKVLALKGHQATSVNESSETIRVAHSITPDLILLDLMMPEPNGFEVCKMLRADPIFANTPIVIITAMDDNASKETAYSAGANDFLTKPFRMDDLAQTIQALIGQAE